MMSHDHIHKIGYKPNIHLMNRMIPSLTAQLLDDNEEECVKMSSSDSNSKIELTETVKNIRKKINKAYLEEGNGKSPVFEFVRHVIFPINTLMSIQEFVINRDEKYGGTISYSTIDQIVKSFEEKILSPQDLKLGISDWIINFLEPVRQYFSSDLMVELINQAYPNK
jgi:tyrosyl-tRNA synthetase